MDYKEFFENALSEAYENAPFSDDEELFKIVKERTSSMKTKNIKWKKPVAITAAVLSAAAVVTVTAGAALNWDFNSAFGGLFSHKNDGLPDQRNVHFEVRPDNSIEIQHTSAVNTYTNEEFDYTKYGRELDLSFEGEGFTVEYKGMMGEGRVLYLLYDVIFDEEADYTPKDGYTDWEPVMTYDTTDDLGRSQENRLLIMDGNRYSYYGKMISVDDLNGKTLTLKCHGMRREIKGSVKLNEDDLYMERLACDFYTEIPIDIEAEVPARTIELNEPLTAYDFVPDENSDNGSYTFVSVDTVLYDMTITPFTCTGRVETNGRVFGKAEGYEFDSFVFTFRDGTTLTQSQIYSEDTFFFDFDRPVEPYDIVSVTIGEKTIPLN